MGEQQLVEIARALSVSARILIMDEPTSALSPAECRRLFTIIRQLASAGVAIIYISHRIEEVMLLADRVTVLRDGCHVVTKPRAALTQETIIAAMVGRESLGNTREQPNAAGRVVLSVRDLSNYCYAAKRINCAKENSDKPLYFYAFEWTNARLGKKIEQINLKGTTGFKAPKTSELIEDNAVVLLAISVVEKRQIPPNP